MTTEYVPDERRTAPTVHEWAAIRHSRTQQYEDRVAVARHLYRTGMPKAEIADVVGVHWAAVDKLLVGLA